MISVICPENAAWGGEIVRTALCRSFSASQVQAVTVSRLKESLSAEGRRLVVVVQPREEWSGLIIDTLKTCGSKVLVLGGLPGSLASHLAVATAPLDERIAAAAHCPSTPAGYFTESPLRIMYRRPLGAFASPLADRPFLRYDFTDEWNNLGYGAIRADGSIWSLAQVARAPEETVIANVVQDGASVSTFAAVWEMADSSILWFNRPVGPVDSPEWRLVEYFFSSHRHPSLPCVPAFSEVPFGYDAAVTMRLDCDEDVASARPLVELYAEVDVPISLAVTTSHLGDKRHEELIGEVLRQGGAILSHSVTHPVNWGGSYDAAFNEATESRASLESLIGKPVRYAVSPFHHTPIYARAALADAGYAGCIGGIISSDPDFLSLRGGVMSGGSAGFVGHSQQCMLHGDCLLTDGDALQTYKKAFDIAFASHALFGYLDHPFSPRYQYGWQNEDGRLAAHRQLLEYIRTRGRILFLNETDALDLMSAKSAIVVRKSLQGFAIENLPSRFELSIEYAGKIMPAPGELPF